MSFNGPWDVNVHYNNPTSGKKNRFQIIIFRLKRLGPRLDTRGTLFLLPLREQPSSSIYIASIEAVGPTQARIQLVGGGLFALR